jgi:uncharacterized RDD family membrane protein YckC
MNSGTATNQYQLAGRGARLGAALLDMVIFAACLAPGIIALSSSDSEMGKGVGIALLVIAWLALMIIQAVFLIKRGQSLGKMAVGIKIVRVSDETVPGFVKVFLLRLLVPGLLYGIPYLGVVLWLVDLLFIFREDRRCLHDMIAETKVVDATAVLAPAIVAPASRPTFSASTSSAYASTPSHAPVRNSQSTPDTVSMSTSISQEDSLSSTLQTPPQAPAVAPFAFDEDAVYEVVANEMESGKKDKGLWTRLFAELDGDEKKTKIAYIKQRAEKLMASERARFQEEAQLRADEAARMERLRIESMSLREKLYSGNITPDMAEKIRNLSATNDALTFMSNVRLNKLDKVNELLEKEPFLVAVSNSDGMTPLHISVDERYVAMSRLLIQRGSPVDAKNNGGQTPLDLAKKTGNQDLVALIAAVG